MHSQLVVLGGGPGGYAAAFIAADEGLEVTLVEQDSHLGGTCLLRGCIPSKALLHVARVMAEVAELEADWGVRFGRPEINLDQIRARKQQVIDKMSAGCSNWPSDEMSGCCMPEARWSDGSTLILQGDDAALPDDGRLTFDHLILATGSTAVRPGSLSLDSARVIDSTGALDLADVPARLLVIGGGYIGLEMATVYAHLGSQVSIVELTEGLLPGADRDLVRPLHQRLKELTADRIFLNTRVGSLGERGDQVEVAFEGPGKYGTEQYDRVLVAVGRRPNSADLGLEHTQVQLDPRGFVVCDAQQRTAESQILAIGDVAGEPMLAHKASHEAKVAVEALLGKPALFEPAAIPAVVFTDPEIAWAGLTEEQAKQQGSSLRIGGLPLGGQRSRPGLGTDRGTDQVADRSRNPATARLRHGRPRSGRADRRVRTRDRNGLCGARSDRVDSSPPHAQRDVDERRGGLLRHGRRDLQTSTKMNTGSEKGSGVLCRAAARSVLRTKDARPNPVRPDGCRVPNRITPDPLCLPKTPPPGYSTGLTLRKFGEGSRIRRRAGPVGGGPVPAADWSTAPPSSERTAWQRPRSSPTANRRWPRRRRRPSRTSIRRRPGNGSIRCGMSWTARDGNGPSFCWRCCRISRCAKAWSCRCS